MQKLFWVALKGQKLSPVAVISSHRLTLHLPRVQPASCGCLNLPGSGSNCACTLQLVATGASAKLLGYDSNKHWLSEQNPSPFFLQFLQIKKKSLPTVIPIQVLKKSFLISRNFNKQDSNYYSTQPALISKLASLETNSRTLFLLVSANGKEKPDLMFMGYRGTRASRSDPIILSFCTKQSGPQKQVPSI